MSGLEHRLWLVAKEAEQRAVVLSDEIPSAATPRKVSWLLFDRSYPREVALEMAAGLLVVIAACDREKEEEQ